MSPNQLRSELATLAETAAEQAGTNTADAARTLALHNDMVRAATGVDPHHDDATK